MLVFVGLLIIATFESTISEDVKTEEEACGLKVSYDDTYCHYSEPSDDITRIEKRKKYFPETSIFFIETSCRGGLNFRQACSVEAAARAHPQREINVLFAGPVSRRCLKTSPLSEILKYKNINLYRVSTENFVRNTTLESLWASQMWNNSYFLVHHTSDILRYVTLYKFGGTYLDLDVLVVKSFDDLPQKLNWVGRASNASIGSALLSLSKNGIGDAISSKALELIEKNFRTYSSSYNSVNVITDVLQDICTDSDINMMTAENCRGFHVYDYSFFYKIPASKWEQYFQVMSSQVNADKDAFAYHIWNRLSQDGIIYFDSLYAQLMKQHCPKIFTVMGADNLPLE